MKNLSFDRTGWLILLLMAIAVAAITAYSELVGLPPPDFQVDSDSLVGINGPVTVKFTTDMNQQTVIALLNPDSGGPGRIEWSDSRTLNWYPPTALQPGKPYQLLIAAGAASNRGITLKSAVTWSFTSRMPEILFLTPSGGGDLWRTSLQTGTKTRITETGDRVSGFDVSPTGEKVVFSSRNDSGGFDLWVVSRDGRNPKILVACGSDQCDQPTWSPNGNSIAYSRISEGDTQVNSRLWLVDPLQGKALPIFADPTIQGNSPDWSPTGDWLAYLENGLLRLYDVSKKQVLAISSEKDMSGSWTSDGKSYIYPYFVQSDSDIHTQWKRIDLLTHHIEDVMTQDIGSIDYGRPIQSPDGLWVNAIREYGGPYSRQLTLMNMSGGNRTPITNDPLTTNGSYVWSPDGQFLAFQQLLLGGSANRPAVSVWDRVTHSIRLIAQDAAHPVWIP